MLKIKLYLPSDRNAQYIPEWVTIESALFKGGEVNSRLTPGLIQDIPKADAVALKTYLDSPETCFELMLVVDAIRRIDPSAKLFLDMGYVPYARQDRVCNPGEANGIAVFADLINNMHFERVTILDPHSDVTPAVLHRSFVMPLSKIMAKCPQHTKEALKDFWLVAPDAGAQKRVKALAEELGCKGYISATKDRDLETMEIKGIKFDADTTGKKLLVVDDICDGGRTFIALAEAIRAHGQPEVLNLWVTHGIFSYGTTVVTKHYDRVTTTNTFRPNAIGDSDGEGNTDSGINWLSI